MGGVGGAHQAPVWQTFDPKMVQLKAKDVMDDGGKLEKLVGDSVLDANELKAIAGADGKVDDGELQKAGFTKAEDRTAILKAIGTNTAKTGFDPIGMRFDGLHGSANKIETVGMFSPPVAAGMVVADFPMFGAGSAADFAEMEAKKMGHLMANVGHMLQHVTNKEELHHALDTLVKDAMAAFGKDSIIAGMIAGAADKITHVVNTICEGAKDGMGNVDWPRVTAMATVGVAVVAVQAVPGLNVAVDGIMALVAGADAAGELGDAFTAIKDQFQGKGSGFRTGAEIGQAVVAVAMTCLAVGGTKTAIHSTGKILSDSSKATHHMAHAITHTSKNAPELTHIAEMVAKLLTAGR